MASQSSDPLSNLRAVFDKVQAPEFVLLALDQVQKSDDDSPRMWAMDDQSLKENPCDLLSDI